MTVELFAKYPPDDKQLRRMKDDAILVNVVILHRRSATVLHQPLIEPNNVKWRLAGQVYGAELTTARRRLRAEREA